MGKRAPGFSDLLRQAQQVQRETREKMSGLQEIFPAGIDAVLQLPALVGPLASGTYQFWAGHLYVAAGPGLLATYSLLCNGYYLEAYQLTRHSAESLVQVAYFSSRTEQAEEHLTPEMGKDSTCGGTGLPSLPKRKRRAQFKTMFDAVSPGYYQRIYPLVSDAAHGGLTLGSFRNDFNLERPLRAGLFFDSKGAMVVITQLAVVTLGFLRWFPKAYPASGVPAANLTASAEAQLCRLIDAQWRETPDAQPMLAAAKGLMLWSPPG